MKIQFINKTRRKVPTGLIRRDIEKILSRFGGRRAGLKKFSSLIVVFVSNEESRRLNRKFLKKNQPANVLSFGYNSGAELILAPAFIRRQARAEGRPYRSELLRMIAHGMLHLIGCHHEKSRRQARIFERLENDILKYSGIEKTQ